MSQEYDSQHRGDRGAYERYLNGMDVSMRQKVALTAAHLLCVGRVADMGMGSGTGSHALAALYPGLDVTGVDVSSTMVSLAQERYQLPNLSFLEGDISDRVFPEGSLDAILDSSVLHHVTSFGGYEPQNAAQAIASQVTQLRHRGVLVVRDFLVPGQGQVWLDLPDLDGDRSTDPEACSTAALFERFAKEFRSLSGEPGFELGEVFTARDCPLKPGFRRFVVSHKVAAEFLLRKDYRRDWDSEVQEEYTYFSQQQFESLFSQLGLRVLASSPLRNPWIVRHRFVGKMALWTLGGEPIEPPPTNYVIVGEKVPPGEGVRFTVVERREPIGFLAPHFYRHRATGKVKDLVRRPNRTIDILPWFVLDGDLLVLARRSYPRPIMGAGREGEGALDRSVPSGYLTEPLNVIQGDLPLGQTVDRALERHAAIESTQIRSFLAGTTYYPSPGGVQEEVKSALVEVRPKLVEKQLEGLSGLSTSGIVRAIEACQLLRGAQVGALPDARLELNVYQLLAALRRDPGPWIGERLDLGEPPATSGPRVTAWKDLCSRPRRRAFEPVDASASRGFLDLRCARFAELDCHGSQVAEATLEYVVPTRLSLNTMAATLLWRKGERVYMGLDDDDLPAAQSFTGNSELLVAPAWRLPEAVTSMTVATEWVQKQLEQSYGVHCASSYQLGGPYFPSPGVTPEVVHPIAFEVTREQDGVRALLWVALDELVEHMGDLADGHLRIGALRAAHALGLLTEG